MEDAVCRRCGLELAHRGVDAKKAPKARECAEVRAHASEGLGGDGKVRGRGDHA